MAEKANINSAEHWNKRWAEQPMRSKKIEKAICGIVETGTSVLDIGCGAGYILQCLKKKGCKVYGIDISKVAIEMCRKQGIAGEVFDAEHLDDFWADKEVFDVVVVSHTLEHISNDEKFVENVARITGKYAIFAVPNNCIGPDEEPEHMRKYTVDSLGTILSRYFSRIEVKIVGLHLLMKAYA